MVEFPKLESPLPRRVPAGFDRSNRPPWVLSKIEWTEQTWNPVTGLHQDVARLQALLRRTDGATPPGDGRAGLCQGFDLTFVMMASANRSTEETHPLFLVCLMADLFHEDVPDAFIDRY